MVFAIHWHESAMDLHVSPIPIPKCSFICITQLLAKSKNISGDWVTSLPSIIFILYLWLYPWLYSCWKYLKNIFNNMRKYSSYYIKNSGYWIVFREAPQHTHYIHSIDLRHQMRKVLTAVIFEDYRPFLFFLHFMYFLNFYIYYS